MEAQDHMVLPVPPPVPPPSQAMTATKTAAPDPAHYAMTWCCRLTCCLPCIGISAICDCCGAICNDCHNSTKNSGKRNEPYVCWCFPFFDQLASKSAICCVAYMRNENERSPEDIAALGNFNDCCNSILHCPCILCTFICETACVRKTCACVSGVCSLCDIVQKFVLYRCCWCINSTPKYTDVTNDNSEK